MPYATSHNWNIVGHKRITDGLEKAIKNDKISHAYLFSGPASIGKMTLAKEFAKILQCKSKVKSQKSKVNIPCNECFSCKQIEENKHPDTLIISPEENTIKIEQIRDLQHILSLHPLNSLYKIAIIENAEKMTQDAANSLLKTLEEPTNHTILILTTEKLNLLLETVVSRCQIIKFLPVSKEIIKKELIKKKSINKSEAGEISSFAQGRPGVALKILENPAVLKKHESILKNLIRLTDSDLVSRFQFVKEISKDKSKINEILNIWLSGFRDSMLIRENYRQISNLCFLEILSKIYNKYSISNLEKLIRKIQETQYQISKNINTKLALEVLMLEL